MVKRAKAAGELRKLEVRRQKGISSLSLSALLSRHHCAPRVTLRNTKVKTAAVVTAKRHELWTHRKHGKAGMRNCGAA
jgi:hypothetical protein